MTEQRETTPTEKTTADIAPPRRRRAPSVARSGLLFALLFALFALQPLCTTTLQRLFSERGGQRIQEEIARGLPVPDGLAWNGPVDNVVETLGNLTPPALLALGIAVVCIGLYALLRILNSTFRLTSGVDWDHTLLTRTYMHTPPLIKAFLIGIGAFLPAFVIWVLVGRVVHNASAAMLVRLVGIGAAIWLLFGREGVAGDFESGGYELPAQRRTTASVLFRGAAAGLACWLALAWTPVGRADLLFPFFRSLGGIGEAQWVRMAAITSAIAAVRGSFVGGLFVVLGAHGMAPRRRAAAAVLPCAVLLLGVALDRYALPAYLRARFDFDAATARPLELKRFSERAGVTMAGAGEQIVLIPDAMRTGVLRVRQQSISGLSATPESARRIEAFLKQRSYATAFSYPAFVTLLDTAALNWDEPGSLEASFTNLTRCPEPRQLSLFLDKLRNSPATPEVLRIADKLADDRYFEFNDRDAATLMGDMFARFGNRQKAESWYKRAGIPPGAMEPRLDERVGFAEGKLTGRLTLNGAAVAGAHVGIVPMIAFRQLMPLTSPDGTLSPFWLWWINHATTTDASGSFTLEHVVQGPYRVVVTVPGLDATRAASLVAPSAPGVLVLSKDRPVVALGTLALTSGSHAIAAGGP